MPDIIYYTVRVCKNFSHNLILVDFLRDYEVIHTLNYNPEVKFTIGVDIADWINKGANPCFGRTI